MRLGCFGPVDDASAERRITGAGIGIDRPKSPPCVKLGVARTRDEIRAMQPLLSGTFAKSSHDGTELFGTLRDFGELASMDVGGRDKATADP